MNDIISKAREFLKTNGLNCLLVSSTNEFLVEYNELAENSRYTLTKFSGSTGDVLLTPQNLYLFVDGRYHIQADNEVDHDLVTVVKLTTGQNFLDEFCKLIPENSVLGLFSRKTGLARYEKIRDNLTAKNCEIKLLENDPFSSVNRACLQGTVEIAENITGKSVEEKLEIIKSSLNDDEALLVTNLEEVSYLFNLRNFSVPYSSKIKGKAFITRNDAKLFLVENLESYENYIKNYKGKIYIDKSSINLYDYELIKDRACFLTENKLSLMKSVKNEVELANYKDCFKRTDETMYAIREFIEKNDELSEFDIAQKLEEYFYKFGAKGLSFRSIVAVDKNSALAHYSKTGKDVILKDGGLVLIDCGAYYEGGLATDITRVFVKGEPSELQKRVYTTVLKMFLNAFNYPLNADTTGFEIDKSARRIEEENKIDGFVFNHGLGHGIGINVHEYPPNLSSGDLAKVKIQDNMTFTIEPGLYNVNHFGIRLENSCYRKNGKIISFTDMCYENKLIDYLMLNDMEKIQLSRFKVL